MSDVEAPDWERNFRHAVTSRREQLGMSQTALARALSSMGVPFRQQMIQRVESGDRAIRLNEAVALSRILGVPLGDGIEGDMGADPESILRWKIDSDLRECMSIVVAMTQVSNRVRAVGDGLYELTGRLQGSVVSDDAKHVYDDVDELFGIIRQLMRTLGTAEVEALDALKPLLKKYGLWDRHGKHPEDSE